VENALKYLVLDYQLRSDAGTHRSGKNKTDQVDAVDHIHYRYLPALIYPIFATLRPFLEKDPPFSGRNREDASGLALKSIILQVTLWSRANVGVYLQNFAALPERQCSATM
jgi:hypothetical protein